MSTTERMPEDGCTSFYPLFSGFCLFAFFQPCRTAPDLLKRTLPQNNVSIPFSIQTLVSATGEKHPHPPTVYSRAVSIRRRSSNSFAWHPDFGSRRYSSAAELTCVLERH